VKSPFCPVSRFRKTPGKASRGISVPCRSLSDSATTTGEPGFSAAMRIAARVGSSCKSEGPAGLGAGTAVFHTAPCKIRVDTAYTILRGNPILGGRR